MAPDGGTKLEALRHAATLAWSGFLLMSSLAALGSGNAHAASRRTLEERSFQDSSAYLVQADQRPDTQPALAVCRSARTRSTSGCSSPTRSMTSDSTSISSSEASPVRPASTSMLAYSNLAPVANR